MESVRKKPGAVTRLNGAGGQEKGGRQTVGRLGRSSRGQISLDRCESQVPGTSVAVSGGHWDPGFRLEMRMWETSYCWPLKQRGQGREERDQGHHPGTLHWRAGRGGEANSWSREQLALLLLIDR